MISDQALAEMIGDDLAAGVFEARTRLDDPTIMVRCEVGLWLVERAGAAVVTDLDRPDVVGALEALT